MKDSPDTLAQRGSVLLIVMTAIVLISLVIPGIMESFRFKNAAQNSFRSDDLTDAVVQAVVARATADLISISKVPCGIGACNLPGQCAGFFCQTNCDCTSGVATIRPQFPPQYFFRPGSPKIYGKGDPAIAIELRDRNGNSFPQRLYLLPETDPQAWIDGDPLQNGTWRYWRLRVRFQACRVVIGGRVLPGGAPYGQGVPWPTACPGGHQRNVDYSGLVVRNNI